MPQRIGLGTAAALALLTICRTVSRSVQAVHLSLFSILWVTLPFLFAAVQPWPFSLLIPLVTYRITITALPLCAVLSAGFAADGWDPQIAARRGDTIRMFSVDGGKLLRYSGYLFGNNVNND